MCNPCHLFSFFSLSFCHIWQYVLRLTGPLRNTVSKANSRDEEEQRGEAEESDYDSCHIVPALSQASDRELAKCQPMEMNKAMLFLSTLNPVSDVLSLCCCHPLSMCQTERDTL